MCRHVDSGSHCCTRAQHDKQFKQEDRQITDYLEIEMKAYTHKMASMIIFGIKKQSLSDEDETFLPADILTSGYNFILLHQDVPSGFDSGVINQWDKTCMGCLKMSPPS